MKNLKWRFSFWLVFDKKDHLTKVKILHFTINVSFIPYFVLVFGHFWQWSYENITKSLFTFCKARCASKENHVKWPKYRKTQQTKIWDERNIKLILKNSSGVSRIFNWNLVFYYLLQFQKRLVIFLLIGWKGSFNVCDDVCPS